MIGARHALILAALCVAQPAWSQERVIYREIFPNQNLPNAKENAFSQGWFGEQHGSAITTAANQDLQLNSDSPSTEEQAINSNPQGDFPPSGRIFYSPNQRAGIYIFTDEYKFQSATLRRVSVDSSNSTCDNEANCPQGSFDALDDSLMRPAFRIGDTWYIAVEGKNVTRTDALDWQTSTFEINALTFLVADVYNEGECQATDTNCLPRLREPQETVASLPPGEVSAFGIYIKKNFGLASGGNGTVRLDNFTLYGEPLAVGVDVRPWAAPNWIVLFGLPRTVPHAVGVLPVALLASEDLDVAEINPATVEIGDPALAGVLGRQLWRHRYQDVNGDGRDDLVLFFGLNALVAAGALGYDTEELRLTAETFDGAAVAGSDAVRVLRIGGWYAGR